MMERKAKKQKSRALQKIEAGGGVLFRTLNNQIQILLIKRNGVWDLPKGKKEEGETIKTCAEREVAEEVGIEGVETVQFLCDTYHEYRQKGELFGKTTCWFAMKPVADVYELSPQTDEGITELEWVEVNAGYKRVGYENLRDVIDAFQRKITP